MNDCRVADTLETNECFVYFNYQITCGIVNVISSLLLLFTFLLLRTQYILGPYLNC
jgi:hypothetical protein